jgi:hypothetical protein
MNQPPPEPDDDGRGAEPEDDDPVLAEGGAVNAPGDEAAPGQPETGGSKYRPL